MRVGEKKGIERESILPKVQRKSLPRAGETWITDELREAWYSFASGY